MRIWSATDHYRVAIHLHCCFLLNWREPRTDEIYALVGLALRLAVIAGFHRDGTWWQLAQRESDARRRIWWEILTLERINVSESMSNISLD